MRVQKFFLWGSVKVCVPFSHLVLCVNRCSFPIPRDVPHLQRRYPTPGNPRPRHLFQPLRTVLRFSAFPRPIQASSVQLSTSRYNIVQLIPVAQLFHECRTPLHTARRILQLLSPFHPSKNHIQSDVQISKDLDPLIFLHANSIQV